MTYESVKEILDSYTNKIESVTNRLCAGFCAGIVAAVATLPPDNIKTKL